MSCPLCKSINVTVVDKIKKDTLVSLYENLTNMDISYLITGDVDFCVCSNCKLKFYDPLITGDEKFYNSLQKFDWYYMDEKEEYHYAKNYINETDKVLEVGSGRGAFAKHLSTTDYIGLDFSEKAISMAAENGVLIKNVLIQDYAKTHSEEFDVVVSFQVLEHVSEPKEFIEGKLQTLRVGGKLIIAVPSEDSFLKYVSNGILNMPPHHVTRWSDETFRFIAEKYNLDIVDIYHEKVQEVHKKYFFTTLLSHSIYPNKMIDVSLLGKLKKLLATFLARFFLGVEREMLPNGHNVLVVYKKKGAKACDC